MAKLKISVGTPGIFVPALLGQFEADDIKKATANEFKLKFADDYADRPELQGWSVSYKAQNGDFQYLGVEPVAGLVGSVEVRDADGVLVLKISNFAEAEQMDLSDLSPRIVDGFGQGGPDYQKVFELLMHGNDTITGSNDDDSINPNLNAGNDVINALKGNDWVSGSGGNDTMNGGDGFDVLDYGQTWWDSTAYRGIKVDMNTNVVDDSWGGTDTFSNFEQINGSRFADTYIARTGDTENFQFFLGDRGADKMIVEVGNQFWTSYIHDADNGGNRGIIANLGGVANGDGDVKGTIRDGFGTTDKTTNVHRVEGTFNDDSFTGSRLNDMFNGLKGADTFNGGDGVDFVLFDNSHQFGGEEGAVINFGAAKQIVNDGFGNAESISGIEGFVGTRFNDKMTGGKGAQVFIGGGGQDTLKGGDGADKFVFGFNNHRGEEFADVIKDFTSGKDVLVFSWANIDDLDAELHFSNRSGPRQKAGVSEFYFNADDSTLYLDTDGKGSNEAIAVAVLEGVESLQASDFLMTRDYLNDL